MAHVNAFGEVAAVPGDRRRGGIAAITVAVCLLSLSDSLVKLAGDDLALGQLFLLRSTVAGFLLALAVALSARAQGLRARCPAWVTLRSLCLTVMWFLYYAALPALPFAVAAAGFYTAPLWMALLSRLVFGRRIGRVRWLAIGIGMTGILVLLRPGPEAVSAWFALPIGAAVCYALAGLITRERLADEAALTMAFNLNAVMAFAGAAWIAGLGLVHPDGEGFLLAAWRDLSASGAALIGILAALLAIVAVLVAAAYQSAPTPLIGLFDNAYLVFATLWGALIFGSLPGIADAFGILLVGGGAALMACAEVEAGARLAP